MKNVIVVIGFVLIGNFCPLRDAEGAQAVPAPAGQNSAAGETPVIPPQPPGVDPQPIPVADATNAKKPRGSVVIAPLPVVSPAIGSGLIPVGGYIFQLQEKDTKSPPSLVGAAGLITDNGSRAIALLTDLYMKENRYELRAIYVNGALAYDISGEGYEDGAAGLKLPLKQNGQVLSLTFLRNLKWGIFAGPHFLTGESRITLNPSDGPAPPVPQDVGLNTHLTSLGLEVVRDSRPNRFYPENGSLVEFTADFFDDDLGSKYSFQSYTFTFNKYWTVHSKQVLAYNLFLCGTAGDAPFYGKCIYGTNNQLRGYTAGQYLDDYMFASQVEYRVALRWRLGLVGFGGIGAVAPGASKFRSDQLLPAGGTGVRFLLSRSFHVNLRTDFAWGKDNFTWSVSVGEAF